MNLRGVDLNLFTVFAAVYEDRNQARAAERLGMTQPAVSNAMGRLRHVVQDQLFVAGSKGVCPTPRADALYQQVHQALELIREGVEGLREFDPATARQTFAVATPYGGGVLFALRLHSWLKREAPHAMLSIQPLHQPGEIPRLLREGALDLAIDYVRYPEASLVYELLEKEQLVVIARQGHPRLRDSLTVEMLWAEEQVRYFDPHRQGMLPEMERTLGMSGARVAIEVWSALALPMVVNQTDLIAVLTKGIAALCVDRFGLNVFPLPYETPEIPIYLIWHASRDKDPAHRWLRDGVKLAAHSPPAEADLDAGPRRAGAYRP